MIYEIEAAGGAGEESKANMTIDFNATLRFSSYAKGQMPLDSSDYLGLSL
jgi:hypothetical protein